MTDFNYKKYSLEKLEEWMHDAMSAGEATPQEIYDVIKGVVEENYYTYKHQASQAYELLALINGNGKGHVEAYDEYAREWEIDKTDVSWAKEKLTCDKDDSSPECKGAWNNFWEEEVKDDGMRPWGHSDMEYLIANKDKVKKWILPVEEVENGDTGEQEYFITFPDDLLEAANLKQGDHVEWVDNEDGTYTLKKKGNEFARVKTYKEIGNELAKVKTYQEMIDDGWTMTDDGFWIKE
jgi:bifunctional DNA-binding transcriptional regulator/antitoxin component of YhaV-PrlF toxin-antitoxin module